MLLWKLLRRHFSATQLAGFFLANFIGLGIVLAGLQFYCDVLPIFTAGDSFMKKEYIVITKHVGMGHAMHGTAPAFGESEIRELAEQDFTQAVGRFTPACFDVYAQIGSSEAGITFGTEMFFESIPDEFIDTDLSNWHYGPDSDTIPVILPKNYLNLYNFGFAGSRGLPAVSEGLVGMITIRFRLRGSHGQWDRPGRVVAFSNRLNTILVPQDFMEQANATLSPDRQAQPARLIIDVENPADENIARYLAENNYETEAGGGDNGRTAYFLRLTVGIVAAVGLLICALSLYILLLSLFLLLQKHTEKIDNLLLIGYRPATVARPFHLLALGLSAGSWLLATAAVLLLRQHYVPELQNVYPAFSPASPLPMVLAGAALFAIMAALNYLAVRRKIMAVWNLHK